MTLALLAVALRPPTDPRVLEMCLEELVGRTGNDAKMGPWIREAARLAREMPMDREYHRVFLGPERPLAPPFESVYRDGTAFGPSTTEFLAELRDAGLEPDVEFRLPPDHVTLQLEYLATLVARAEDAQVAGRSEEASEWRERARSFADRHLSRWIPRFLARLEAGAPGHPYTLLVRAASEATRACLLGGDG